MHVKPFSFFNEEIVKRKAFVYAHAVSTAYFRVLVSSTVSEIIFLSSRSI